MRKHLITIACLLTVVLCFAGGEKKAYETYVNWLKSIHSAQGLYTEIVSYQLLESDTMNYELVKTWAKSNSMHVIAQSYEYYIDTLHEINVFHSASKILIKNAVVKSDESLLAKKQELSKMSYSSLQKDVDQVTWKNHVLTIDYSSIVESNTAVRSYQIWFEDDNVIKTVLERKLNGEWIKQVSHYLTISELHEESVFDGTALEQISESGILKEAFKKYQVVNLTSDIVKQ